MTGIEAMRIYVIKWMYTQFAIDSLDIVTLQEVDCFASEGITDVRRLLFGGWGLGGDGPRPRAR